MHRTLTGDIELHYIIRTQQKQQGEVNESQKFSDFDHTFVAIRKLAPDRSHHRKPFQVLWANEIHLFWK